MIDPDETKVKLIKKIGGHLLACYNRFIQAIIELEYKSLPPLKALHLANNLSQLITNSNLDACQIREKFTKRYISKRKDKKESKRVLSNNAKKCYEHITEIYGLPYRVLDIQIILYFKKALSFDKEKGLEIDIDKFLESYKSHTKGEQTELYLLQKTIVDGLNVFFQHSVTERDIRCYFKIQNGRIAIEERNVNEEHYLRLSNGTLKYRAEAQKQIMEEISKIQQQKNVSD